MEVSGQLHAPAAFSQERIPVPFEMKSALVSAAARAFINCKYLNFFV